MRSARPKEGASASLPETSERDGTKATGCPGYSQYWHRLQLLCVPKDAARFLDSAVRLLRRKAVSLMLGSQKINDLDPAMRSAMNVSIFFRTKCEGHLSNRENAWNRDVYHRSKATSRLLHLSPGGCGTPVNAYFARHVFTAAILMHFHSKEPRPV